MPYCSWCQLDSELDDTCVWCKRPLARTGSVYGGRSAVALLREDSEAGDTAFSVVGAVVGALVVVVAIYAAVSYGKSPSGSSSTTLAPERTMAAQRQASAPAGVAVSLPASEPVQPPRLYAPPATTWGTPVTPPAPNGDASAVASVPVSVSMMNDSGMVANGVYIESANLASTRQEDGKYTIEGTVYVVNVSGDRATDITFSISTAGGSMLLKSTRKELEHGGAARFDVLGIDVTAELAQSPDARVRLTATTSAGTVTDGLALGS